MRSHSLFGLLLSVTVCIHSVLSISCYWCNSALDSRCGDSQKVKDATDLLVDCSTLNDTRSFTRCLKMTQTVESQTRTIRSCATASPNSNIGCSSKSGTARIWVTSCECTGTDGCNKAGNVRSVSKAAFVLPVVVAVVLSKFLRMLGVDDHFNLKSSSS